ncbi:MAG: hypothetical protein M3485_00180 [Pseudomonadota bacterium]|nr:hypothetical protein [Pseudomonadota bacterium]
MKMLTLAIAAALVTTVAGSAAMAQVKGKPAVANNMEARELPIRTRAEISARGLNGASPYQAKTSRGAAVGTIVRTWGGYVQKIHGTSPSDWARNMGPTFAQADVRNLQRAARMTTFEGMMSALMGQRTSDAELINTMARSDGSLPAIQALGSPSVDLVYTGVVPCRLFDTRVAGGAIAAEETRDFNSFTTTDFTAQGGAASDCGIPASASVVVVNVTAIRPTTVGFLTVFPFASPKPFAASVNFIVNAENGNELLVKQTMGQAFQFSVFAKNESHVAGDVAGYFAAPMATALECVQVAGSPVSILPGATGTALAQVCPSGFTGTSTRCEQNFGIDAVILSITSDSCTFLNLSLTNTATAVAVRDCCRVPGR